MVNVAGRKRADNRKRSGFVYKPPSAKSVKERADRTGGRFDSPFKQGVDVWRPKVGTNYVRILPPTWDGHDHYALTTFMHRFVGPDNSSYLCPMKMQNKKCPICSAAREAKDAGEEDEQKALQWSEQLVCWIIDRDDESDPPQPQLWQMSWPQDRDISGLRVDARTGKVLLIDDPDEGYDLIVKRTGQGLKTRYLFQIDRDSTPLHDDPDVQEELLAFVQENPVPDQLKFYPIDYLDKMISGTVEAADEDLDQDEDRKPSRRTRARDEEEEEEVEEERPSRRERLRPRRAAAEDEDEEEEEKPRRARRAARDEEEEEEVEDKPRRSTRRARDEEEEDNPLPDEDEPAPEDAEDEDDRRGRRVRARGNGQDEEEDDDRGRRRPMHRQPISVRREGREGRRTERRPVGSGRRQYRD